MHSTAFVDIIFLLVKPTLIIVYNGSFVFCVNIFDKNKVNPSYAPNWINNNFLVFYYIQFIELKKNKLP